MKRKWDKSQTQYSNTFSNSANQKPIANIKACYEADRDECELLSFPADRSHLISLPPAPEFYAQNVKSGNVKKQQTSNGIKSVTMSTDSEPFEANMCYQHYKGMCNTDCNLLHYLRLPKRDNVCKFYAKRGNCAKGASCLYMHSNFPCKYYYLDLAHPPEYNKEHCLFSHGKSIGKQMSEVLIEEAIRSKLLHGDADSIEMRFTKRNAELAERENLSRDESLDAAKHVDEAVHSLTDLIKQGQADEVVHGKIDMELPDELLKLHPILTKGQLHYLMENNIVSLSQIISMPVSQQRAYNLEIHQIYELHLAALKLGTITRLQSPVTNVKPATRNDDESNSNEAEFFGFGNDDSSVSQEDDVSSCQEHQSSISNSKIITNDRDCSDEDDDDDGNVLIINETLDCE